MRRMQRRRQSNVHSLPQSLFDFSKSMRSPECSDLSTINGQKFFIDTIKNQAVLFLSPVMKE